MHVWRLRRAGHAGWRSVGWGEFYFPQSFSGKRTGDVGDRGRVGGCLVRQNSSPHYQMRVLKKSSPDAWAWIARIHCLSDPARARAQSILAVMRCTLNQFPLLLATLFGVALPPVCPARAQTVTVYAAASLTNALEDFADGPEVE